MRREYDLSFKKRVGGSHSGSSNRCKTKHVRVSPIFEKWVTFTHFSKMGEMPVLRFVWLQEPRTCPFHTLLSARSFPACLMLRAAPATPPVSEHAYPNTAQTTPPCPTCLTSCNAKTHISHQTASFRILYTSVCVLFSFNNSKLTF